MAAKKPAQKTPVKTDPLETRLRQFITEIVRTLDDKFDADERSAVVDHVMDTYMEHVCLAADGAVMMSLRDMADAENEEDADVEEEGEE